MADKKLSGSIALTKLVHVRMEMKGKNGMVAGLFIPFAANLLVENEPAEGSKLRAVYMPVNVQVKEEQDKYKQNGFISKTIDSKVWKEMTDEAKEESKKLTPILGNLKDWSTGSNSSEADSSGAASDQTFTEEADDLPF